MIRKSTVMIFLSALNAFNAYMKNSIRLTLNVKKKCSAALIFINARGLVWLVCSALEVVFRCIFIPPAVEIDRKGLALTLNASSNPSAHPEITYSGLPVLFVFHSIAK